MPVSSSVLGMNARNFLYVRQYNTRKAIRMADNKLLTKRLLLQAGIATPKPITGFRTRKKITDFDWINLPAGGFAIKPARGFGGGGIIVFKEWHGMYGITASGKIVTVKQLQTHLLDILDGAFSLQSLPDVAYVEELLHPHSFFKKITPLGLPDIRIIVLHNIPVMAMMRVPNKVSEGKANLMQGAVALGIDMRTGITRKAYSKKSTFIKYLPDTKLKVGGIRVPFWDELLLMAARSQQASGLGYAGVDLVLDEKHGPMVLEVNARPGLAIQFANGESLRTRLERIDQIATMPPERGVEVAKSLFADEFADRVDTNPSILGVNEALVIKRKGVEYVALCEIDTASATSIIDKKLARELDLKEATHKVYIRSRRGLESKDAVIVHYSLLRKKFKITAAVMDLGKSPYKVKLGRDGIQGFLVDPSRGA